jgi:hypothetical protein
MGRMLYKNMTMKGVSMKKVFLGFAVLLVFGFLFAGCDNGTTPDNGTAPVLTRVYIGTSVDDFSPITEASTFTKGIDIHIGADVNDPDADIVKLVYSVKKGGTPVPDLTGEITSAIPFTTLTGVSAMTFQFSKLTDDQKNQTVGTNYTVDVYFVDSKGNKSETKTTNTFAITG